MPNGTQNAVQVIEQCTGMAWGLSLLQDQSYSKERRTVMKRNTYRMVYLSLFVVVLGIMVAQPMQAGEKGKAQSLCPVMGGEIDKTAYVDYEGKRVYFCCPGCKPTFLKDPKKYLKKMESEGIVLEAAPTSKNDSGHLEGGI